MRAGALRRAQLLAALAIIAGPVVGATRAAAQTRGMGHAALAAGAGGLAPRGASVLNTCCTGLLVELRGGRWLSPGRRVDLFLAYSLGWDETSLLPPGPRPPRLLGADTIRVGQHPRHLRQASSSVVTGARAVAEVRDEHGFALRLFGGASWWWQPRFPMASVGGGMRFGPRTWGLALELEGSAAPLPHRATEWRYQDGTLVASAQREEVRWAFPVAVRVALEGSW